MRVRPSIVTIGFLCILLWQIGLLYAQTITAPPSSLINTPPAATVIKHKHNTLDSFFAEQHVDYAPFKSQKDSRTSLRILTSIKKVNEKELIRAQWEQTLGIDVWSPYYKAKEIENKVCEKASVKVFKLKGRPENENGKFIYKFKVAF